MVAAHYLWDVCDTNGVADIEQWSQARETMMSDLDDELRNLWTGFTTKDRATLKFIATGIGPFSRKSGESRGKAVTDSLSRLQGKGAITKRGDSWYVVDPLFRIWIIGQGASG
jgi:hypothetical protein